MGNTDTKIQYRKAVIQLTAMNQVNWRIIFVFPIFYWSIFSPLIQKILHFGRNFGQIKYLQFKIFTH